MNTQLVNPNFQDNYVENLLVSRGIKNINAFLYPSEEYLQSPNDLKSIEIAAAIYLRIMMKQNPKILLVIDPDVDGFTSSAIFYLYSLNVNCHAQIDYLLHEHKTHGISDHIEYLMDKGINYDLLVIPDAGSNDGEFQDKLDEISLPCLVLDHHLVDLKLSDNAIVVNNQLSPNYVNKDLTGAGVTWQFCRYIDSKLNSNWAIKYIDLAALGIIADMGSILSLENRYIIKQGLNNIENEFFKCLIIKQGYSISGKMNPSWNDLQKKLNYISVAFYIVPLINALIRVGSLEEKDLLFKAFLNGAEQIPCNKRGAKGTFERADIEVARICTNSKSKQNKMKEEITSILESQIFKFDLLSNKILFIELDEDNQFPAELNGLIATQLSSIYHKPTIITRLNPEGYLRGSIRGLSNSELISFKSYLMSTGLFEYVQGHDNAAGCSILKRNLDQLHNLANTQLAEYNFDENCYEINFERNANAPDLITIINELCKYTDIWGQNNKEAVLRVNNLTFNKSQIKIMGSNSDTLKIENNGIAYMWFKAEKFIEKLKKEEKEQITLNLIGRANLNEWMGRFTPQIFVDDQEIIQNSLTTF